MKKYILIVGIFCLPNVAFAQQEEMDCKWTIINSSEKIHECFYENGKLKYRRSVINGKMEGYFTMYREDGKLAVKTPFINGQEEGRKQIFHASGALASEVNFVNGKEEGWGFYYLEDDYRLGTRKGAIDCKVYFQNGVAVKGTWYDDYGKEHISNNAQIHNCARLI